MSSGSPLAHSKALQQRTGPTFHLATRLLPRRIRHPTYVLYAFFRTADDVVDTTEEADPDAQRETLEQIRKQALGEVPATDPVLGAFAELKAEHDISDANVERFIDAMIADIDHRPYQDIGALEAYMRGSAVAVANMMLSIMAVEDLERAMPHAAALAEAFQLTNFLRDVAEDVESYQRVYLPADSMADFDVSVAQLRAGNADEGFRRLMQRELARAERRYLEGVAGIEYLPDDCQFGVLVAAVLYGEYHRVIEGQDYDVLTTEPSLSTRRKISLLVRTALFWAFERDPVTVFGRVSAMGRPETAHPHPEEFGIPVDL